MTKKEILDIKDRISNMGLQELSDFDKVVQLSALEVTIKDEILKCLDERKEKLDISDAMAVMAEVGVDEAE